MSAEGHGAAWQDQVAAARAAALKRGPSEWRMDRSAIALAGAFLLAMLVFAIGVALGVRGDDVGLLGLAMLTFLLASVYPAVNWGLPPKHRHTFISLMSLLIIGRYVIPVFTLYLPAEGPVDAPAMAFTALLPRDLVVGQLVSLLAFSVLLGAYALPVGRSLAERLPRPQFDWPTFTILVVSVVLMGVGWPLRLASQVGLVPGEWGTGFLGTLYKGTIYCNAILTLAWIRHRSVPALVLLAVNVLLGVVLGLVGTSKTEVLIRPMMIAITWILARNTIRLRWIAVGVVALALIYPASHFVRNEVNPAAISITRPMQTLGLIAEEAARWEFQEWLSTGLEATGRRTDSLGAASVLIRDTPRVSPFQYGATLKLFFVAFVPRILWPDKPRIGTGTWVTEVYGTGPGFEFHTAPTQIGDYYINFGIPGVIAGMLFLGMVLRLVHESLLRGSPTAASILAAAVVMHYFALSFEGNVAQAYSSLIFALVPIWVIQMGTRLLLPTYSVEDSTDPPEASAPA